MSEEQTINTLKVLRAKKGMTLYDLQLETGLLKGKLSKLERRNLFVRERYEDLVILANTFDMTIEELIEQNKQDRNEEDE